MQRPQARKILAVLAVLALGAVGLAQVTVTFWHSQFDDTATNAMTTLIERFNEEHPDIHIETVNAGNYGEMITKLQAAVVAQRLPDIVQLEITRYGLFAERGVLLPLDDLIANSPDFNADDLIPGIREATLYKGTPYVIPFNNSVPVMYYNKTLFEEAGLDPDAPPSTWEELLDAALALTVRDDANETVQWGLSGPPQWVRNAFVRQNLGAWMNDDLTELTLNEPAAVEAYQFILDLIRVHEVAYAESAIDANQNLARQDFVTGRSGILFGSTGSLGGLLKDAQFELGVAALPCRHTCAAPIGGATVGLVDGTPPEERDAAWTFLTWMTNTENNAYWSTQSGYMPIRQSTFESETAQAAYAANPSFAVAVEQFRTASFPRPRPPAMPAIRQLENQAWEEIVTGSKTIQQALDDLVREANLLLGDN